MFPLLSRNVGRERDSGKIHGGEVGSQRHGVRGVDLEPLPGFVLPVIQFHELGASFPVSGQRGQMIAWIEREMDPGSKYRETRK